MKQILLIYFCLLTQGVWAEGEESPVVASTVRGIVLDENDSPLPGASVWVRGTTIGAGTNARGEFSLNLRTAGGQVLYFSFTGYTPQEYTWSGQSNEFLTIRLKPAKNSLDEVVVTGTRTPKPLKEVPMLTRVISQEDIAQINPINLQDLLQYEMPGLQFGRAHGSGLPELQFQGAAGGYVLFLMDGERLAGEGSSNNIDYERIDIDNIERIEIVKGPMSTLYGSQAMGGVVNIITKDAQRPFTGNISARYGNKEEQKYAVSAGTKQDRFSSLTSFSYRNREAYTVEDREDFISSVYYPDGTIGQDTTSKTITSIRGYDIWQVGQKFGYSFTDHLKAVVDGSYYNNHVLDVLSSKKQDVFSSYTINPRLYYTFKNYHLLEFSYLLDDYRKEIEYKQAPTDKVLDDKTHTLRISYSGLFRDKHTVTAGLEMNTQNLQHYWFDNGSGKQFKAQTYVFYVQEDWKMSEQFSVIAGVRSDCHSDYGFHASPKISFLYKVGVWALRGGYGMGFRIPTLKELHSSYDMGGQGMFMIYGNPDLKPETSHQGTLSAEITKGIFNASVSGYYTRYKDEIALGLTADGKDQQYYNADDGIKSGVDVMGQLRFDWGLTVRGAYSYVDAHAEQDGYNTSAFRPHSLIFTANYMRKFGRVTTSVALNGNWMSKVDTWYKNSDGGYVLEQFDARTFCSLNLSGRFPRGFRLTLGIDNLLNFKENNVSTDSSVTPQRGIGFIGTLGINVADLFKL